MIQTILDFKKLQEEIPEQISESKYKASYFMKELGLTQSTFYRKASTAKFTPTEMLKIVELTNPKEYYRWEFEQEIIAAKEQIATGETLTNKEVIAKITK